MKTNLYFFIKNAIISFFVVIDVFSSISLGTANRDYAPVLPDASISTISSVENLTHNASIASYFSTANVVKYTFSAPIYNVSDMYYHDYNGADHSKDAYAIMEYTKDGGDFFYAHSGGAFNTLKFLREGDIFTIKGQKYQVIKTAVTPLGDITATQMNNIRRSKDGAQVKYDATFMTCSDGYSNTSDYRFVVYANYAG